MTQPATTPPVPPRPTRRRTRIMRKLVPLLGLIALALPLASPGAATASPGDPVHANDVIGLEGWKEKTWAHFGNWQKGEVSAETWVDLHWPCFTSTDEDQDCLVEDVRGHGLVRKLSKVKRTEIDFVRLGRYPAGVLAVNGTNVNSGTLPLIESRTPWVPAEQFCGGSFRTWNRVTFAVRWSDGHLTKGLTLLSDPSEDYSTSICSTFSMTVEQRKAARDRLLQAVK
jgi:hypothetical protein